MADADLEGVSGDQQDQTSIVLGQEELQDSVGPGLSYGRL